MTALLEVENLQKRYGAVVVADDITSPSSRAAALG